MDDYWLLNIPLNWNISDTRQAVYKMISRIMEYTPEEFESDDNEI